MNTTTKLLAVINTTIYTNLGFVAYDFGYTVIQFLVVPVVVFSIALMLKK